MLAGKCSYLRIGKRLRRTADSVESQRLQLGLPAVFKGSYRPWTVKEEKSLQDMLLDGKTFKDVARALKRSLQSVRMRARIKGWQRLWKNGLARGKVAV